MYKFDDNFSPQTHFVQVASDADGLCTRVRSWFGRRKRKKEEREESWEVGKERREENKREKKETYRQQMERKREQTPCQSHVAPPATKRKGSTICPSSCFPHLLLQCCHSLQKNQPSTSESRRDLERIRQNTKSEQQHESTFLVIGVDECTLAPASAEMVVVCCVVLCCVVLCCVLLCLLCCVVVCCVVCFVLCCVVLCCVVLCCVVGWMHVSKVQTYITLHYKSTRSFNNISLRHESKEEVTSEKQEESAKKRKKKKM